MDNAQIASLLLEAAEALEFLEENPFKARAFRNAARSVADLDVEVSRLLEDGRIHEVKGVGPSIATVVKAWVTQGDFSFLEGLKTRLPSGYDELRKVPGLGTKRLRDLWKGLGIQRLEDLQEALADGRIALLKGFSRRHQERLSRSVAEVMSYRGRYRIDEALDWVSEVERHLCASGIHNAVTGVCRRGMEVVDAVEFVCVGDGHELEHVRASLGPLGPTAVDGRDGRAVFTFPRRPAVTIHLCPKTAFATTLFITTGAPAHVDQARLKARALAMDITGEGLIRGGRVIPAAGEEEIYALFGSGPVPPELREGRETEWLFAEGAKARDLVSEACLQGVFHVHTSMSDGKAPLAAMVRAARGRGYRWVGISDHSKGAYYANGLSVTDLMAQVRAVEAMNDAEGDMTVLSGVESDIRPDGALDYPDEVLKRLDFVIASVHSHMDMDRKAMTDRIMRAMHHPATSMLGHPTGRLLLARAPYEVDVDLVLKEASRMGVIVELNAHPMRLDIDWRLIGDFTADGGLVAVNPDAHTPEGLDDMRYGILMARKGLLECASCINCRDVKAVREALDRQWS